MENPVYITIVDENFMGYFEMLKKSHTKFSKYPLICFSINFEIKGEGIINIPLYDSAISDYERGSRNLIQNNADRIAYIIGLKTKIFRISCDLGFSNIMYIDADCLFTPNSDNMVDLLSGSKIDRKFPLSTFYWYKYSTTHQREGNTEFLPYGGLLKKYDTEGSDIWYKTSYCVFFSKESKWFFVEAEEIAMDPENFKNRKNLMYLCDETVFNFLYSKYSFNEGISPGWCKNIGMNMGFDNFSKLYNETSFIPGFLHLKNYKEVLNNIDPLIYNQMINYMEATKGVSRPSPAIEILDYENRVLFSHNEEGIHDIWLENSKNPMVFGRYDIDIKKNVNYYVSYFGERLGDEAIIIRKLPHYFGS